MINREQVSDKVLQLMDVLNEESDLMLQVSEDTVIIGEGSRFDSMAFLDLVGLIEDWIDETFNIYVDLASGEEDFGSDGPFANVGSMIETLTKLINEKVG